MENLEKKLDDIGYKEYNRITLQENEIPKWLSISLYIFYKDSTHQNEFK